MTKQTCTLCQTEIKGLYCYNCGQKSTNKKTTVVTIIGDLISNLFSIENSFFSTFLMAFKKPAFLVNNYFEGNKGVLIAPGKIVLFTSVILALRFYYFDADFFTISLGRHKKEYVLLGLFLIFPILSSTVTFIRHKNIFMRSIISICYFSSFVLLISLIIEIPLLVMGISNSWKNIFIPLAFLTIFILNVLVFAKSKKWYRILFLVILQFIMLIVVPVILFLILSLLGWVTYKITT